MCDTFVILRDSTKEGHVIFGKNSDRPHDEVQDVVLIPRQTYSTDGTLDCTHISIPQVRMTYAMVLSKPRWIWGAEMGSNEKGVVIGNEAVWTTQPYKNSGLLGMDLLRLGLERGDSAKHALNILLELLAEYGQGGNCAENAPMNYHNSFIIADHSEAWVLETAGKYWVAENVKEGVRSISNGLSIQNAGNIRHPQVIEYAVESGLCKGENDFNFARIFSEFWGGNEPSLYSREGRVKFLCHEYKGTFSINTAKEILRDHDGGVCMHGGFQTTGSQISVLEEDNNIHYFIESPLPCTSSYKEYKIPA